MRIKIFTLQLTNQGPSPKMERQYIETKQPLETAIELGRPEELIKSKEILGRTPNFKRLSIYFC